MRIESALEVRILSRRTQYPYRIEDVSSQIDQKAELLNKTADFYRRSITNYSQFVKTERKPRTKKQLELRLQVILEEIESLKFKPLQ